MHGPHRVRYMLATGVWLSLVERSVRDREVGGSNPPTPTIFPGVLRPVVEACRRATDDLVRRARDAVILVVTDRTADLRQSSRVRREASQRHDLGPDLRGVDLEKGDAGRPAETSCAVRRPGVHEQHAAFFRDVRAVGVPRDHDGDALSRGYVATQQALLGMSDQHGHAADLQDRFGRQIARRETDVHVTVHGGDGGDERESLQHALVAHVAGVHDMVDPREEFEHRLVKSSVRVGDDAHAPDTSLVWKPFLHVPSSASRSDSLDRIASMLGLANKRALVTGGTSGIGLATVERFRAEGCDVYVFARHAGDGPGERRVDVGDLTQVQAAFAEIDPVDIVVNNAGISYRHRLFDTTPEEWSEVLATNLTGVFNVAQMAARGMVERGGVIINVSSTNALVGHPFYGDYNATKAAVIALTRTMALEWAPMVRVNAVCPGYVLTPMQETEYTLEMIAAVNEKLPLRRHARPEEIAALFAFLCSDEAAYMTGSVIVMDGGETAGGLASR
jgi:meso-butanediol dehydrogenase/(S,S)-butanediol dehydrogenase/diacetyl reductase